MSNRVSARNVLRSRYRLQRTLTRPKGGCRTSLFRGVVLQIDDSALQSDGDGVRPIVCGQLGKDVLDVALHGLLRDGELRGDELVGVPGSDELEHLNLPKGQCLIGRVLGQRRRYL